MKRLFLNVFVFASLAASVSSCKNEVKNETEAKEAEEVVQATDEVTTYMVIADQSEIMWKGEKPTGTHNGSIKVMDGEIMVGNDMIEGGKVVIDMKSINVEDLEGDEKKSLEAHLMGTVEGKEGDFFNVQKYPKASFEITGMKEMEGKMMLSGNLTLKEKSKNIEIPVKTSMKDGQMEIKSEPFTIDRTNWDVNYGSKSVFDNLGDKFINDDIELTIMLKAKKA